MLIFMGASIHGAIHGNGRSLNGKKWNVITLGFYFGNVFRQKIVWGVIKDRGKFLRLFWKRNWARIWWVFHNTNREKIGDELGGV
jgi:hypothetical protein